MLPLELVMDIGSSMTEQGVQLNDNANLLNLKIHTTKHYVQYIHSNINYHKKYVMIDSYV